MIHPDASVGKIQLFSGNPAIVVAGSRIFNAVDFFLFFAKPIQRWRIHCMSLPTGICVTVLISKIFALALLSEERGLFYLFSLRTLSNSFPLWKEPELTGLFYHIQAPFSTAKYKNQTENAVSRYLSKARRFISRLEPVHKTYGQLSLLVKSRSLLMPMPK